MLRMRGDFILFDLISSIFRKKNLTMRIVTSVFLFLVILSCKSKDDKVPVEITSVEVEEIFEDSSLSIRAIDVASDKSVAFAANNGVFGLYNPQTEAWAAAVQNYDTLNLQFRSEEHTSELQS